MIKRCLPFALLAVCILALALLMPSSTGVRIEPARLTPTPEVTPAPTLTPAPTPTQTPIPVPTEYVLRSMSDSRDYHEDVEWMQARLSRLGFYVGKADGYYGRSTFEAVYNFQRMNGLETDGKAGEETQRTLFESDTVKNSLGNIYTPFATPSPSPTPAAKPTPHSLPMDAFVPGTQPDERWFGGDVYRDNSIDASLTQEGDTVTLHIKIAAPYQFRSALAGSYTLPQSLALDRLARLNRAVVAFAGTDYRLDDDLEIRQQLVMKEKLSDERDLLVIDAGGKLRLYTPANAPKAVEQLGARICQALSVEKTLIANGITQTNLGTEAKARRLALGEAGDRSYVIIDGPLSDADFAARMLKEGCDNAAILGGGGVYTCFGDETAFTYENGRDVSNILYFASYAEGVE